MAIRALVVERQPRFCLLLIVFSLLYASHCRVDRVLVAHPSANRATNEAIPRGDATREPVELDTMSTAVATSHVVRAVVL